MAQKVGFCPYKKCPNHHHSRRLLVEHDGRRRVSTARLASLRVGLRRRLPARPRSSDKGARFCRPSTDGNPGRESFFDDDTGVNDANDDDFGTREIERSSPGRETRASSRARRNCSAGDGTRTRP